MSDVTIINLFRRRGDTRPDKFRVKSRETGLPIDVTGYSFLLTVDPEKNPANDDNNLFQITGVITDADAGEVKFTPTELQADQAAGIYYYDAELVDDAGDRWTFAAGTYQFTQDITK